MQQSKTNKVWVALFFGYVGTNFNGMQWQRQAYLPTVERELISKLHAQGFLQTESYPELVKMSKWSRAARTDKGVHALFNGVSFLITLKEDDVGDKTINTERINMKIRSVLSNLTIYGVKQVNKKFEMRQAVKSRSYCYLCPLFIFDNKSPKQQTIAKINRIGQAFIGTRNYHNYSSRVKAKDPSAKRYITSFECQPYTVTEEPWVKITIHGQSFIYHQIRKMIGIISQIFLFNQPENLIDNTFFNNQIKILLVPAEGLYLQRLSFESYNRMEGIPEKLQFSDQQERIQTLKQTIEQEVFASEKDRRVFTLWLNKTLSNGPDIKYEAEDMQVEIEQ